MTDDLDEWIRHRTPIWKEMLVSGQMGQVMKEIDELPPEADVEKPFIRIQLLHIAGLHGPALEAIEAAQLPDDSIPQSIMKLARIAIDGGGHDIAAKLLSKAVPQLNSQDELEDAVVIADIVGDQPLQDSIVQRLAASFPQSAIPARIKARQHASSGDYANAAAVLPSTGDTNRLASLYSSFAKYVSTTGVAYEELADEAKASPYWNGVGARLVVKEAILRGDLRIVVPIIIQTVSDELIQIDLLLSVLTASFIERGKGKLTQAEQLLLIRRVLTYIAFHPESKAKRIRLVRVLSPEISGTSGMALMALLTYEFAREQRQTRVRKSLKRISAEEFLTDHAPFATAALSWLSKQGMIQVGRTSIPKDLVVGDPYELGAGAMQAIGLLARQVFSDADITILMNWMALVVGLSPHVPDANLDLRAIRLTGGAFANAGKTQHARDLAETAIDNAGSGPERLAVAWSAMADIYNRIGSHLESLIALGCSFSATNDNDNEELWNRFDCGIRDLRDLHLFDLASSLHEYAESLLSKTEEWEANKHRFYLLRLQIDVLKHLARGEGSQDTLRDLVRRAHSIATDVIERNDDPIPITIILAQLLQRAVEQELALDDDVQASFRTLSERSASYREVIEALSKAEPTARDLLLLYRRFDSPRFAEDIAFDQRQIVVVAKRLLGNDDPEVVVLAVELLADRSISDPSHNLDAKPLAPVADEKAPAGLARQLSMKTSIVLAALDREDRLVSVSANVGKLGSSSREQSDIFSGGYFREWAKEFPYRYGVDHSTMNLFYVSTDRLRMSSLPEGPISLVTDISLQQLPPNLLRVGDDFAGLTRPMSAAPSLSWLAAARTRQSTPSQRMSAWIPTERSDAATLGVIADRLKPTFEQYKIELTTRAELPKSLARSSVVVVAAHGALDQDAEFFSHVSDEGNLKSDALEFVKALHHVDIPILFVCSGGRLDRHPSANTTVGLARQLLYQGSLAVIASPWPLDARVPYHWLPEFLRSWTAGNGVAQANFDANLVVAKQLGPDPAFCLAMTVYGDGMVVFKA